MSFHHLRTVLVSGSQVIHLTQLIKFLTSYYIRFITQLNSISMTTCLIFRTIINQSYFKFLAKQHQRYIPDKYKCQYVYIQNSSRAKELCFTRQCTLEPVDNCGKFHEVITLSCCIIFSLVKR